MRRWLALAAGGPAVLLLACGLDATKPSDGLDTPTAGDDVIAFASDRHGDFDLFLATADGSQFRRLTDHLGFDAEPAWAPDGARLVYTSGRSAAAELHILELASLSTRRLTRASGQSISPSWSPDGASIAFVSDREGNADVYVVAADGGEARRLTSSAGADLQPSWSADGGRIAYTSDRGGSLDVFEIDADGTDTAPRLLVGSEADDAHAAWSPDGRWLAFVSDRGGSSEVYRLPADDLTTTPVNVTYDDGDDGFRPSWSADSRRLAFVSHRAGNPDIFTVDVEARSLVALPASPSLTWSPNGTVAAVVPGGGGLLSIVDTTGAVIADVQDLVSDSQAPAWSVDGRRIAFVSTADGASDVFMSDPATGEVLNVSADAGRDDHPTLSPGGERLAFTSERAGAPQILIARLGLDSLSNLQVDTLANPLGEPASAWSPRWSPVGETVAFVSDRDGAAAVYIADLDSAGLAFDGGLRGPFDADRILGWSPAATQLALLAGSDPAELVVVSLVDSSVYRASAPVLGDPVWGGNGRLLYVADVTGDREVYLLELDGAAGTVRNLSNHPGDDDGPVWSPQRDAVAFVSDRDGDGDVYAVRLAGDDVLRLTGESRPMGSLRWWLGSERLFFLARSDGVDALFTQGVSSRLTTSSARDWFPAWGP